MARDRIDRDPELGQALRETLEPADSEQFVQRVMGTARQQGMFEPGVLDSIDRWALPGMVAAAAVAILALMASRILPGTDGTLAEELAVNETNSALAQDFAPQPEVILAAYVNNGGRRR